MKLYERIVVDVRHVDGAAASVDLGVLALHQPPDVREEEPSVRVVRIRVRLAELVVHPVVAYPVRYGVLSVQKTIRRRNAFKLCRIDPPSGKGRRIT